MLDLSTRLQYFGVLQLLTLWAEVGMMKGGQTIKQHILAEAHSWSPSFKGTVIGRVVWWTKPPHVDKVLLCVLRPLNVFHLQFYLLILATLAISFPPSPF